MRSLALMAVVVALGSSAAPGTAAAPSMDAGSGQALCARRGSRPPEPARSSSTPQTGATLYAHNSTASLLPASVEKLAVSYTALHVLGPRFRFRTELVGVGVAIGPRVAGKPRARGVRRSDTHARGSRSARAPVRRHRDPTRSGPRLRRRDVLRLAARRARLEAVVRRHRVATALRALRRRTRRSRAATARPPQRPGRSPSRSSSRHRRHRTGRREDELRPMRFRSPSTSPSGSRTSYRG